MKKISEIGIVSSVIFIIIIILTSCSLPKEVVTRIDHNQRLFGTWYAFDKGKMHTVTFKADKTFEFHVEGIDFNPEALKSRNIEMISNYEIFEGSPNRIKLTINLIHPDTTLSIDLKGIYEFKNDSTMQLDFRSSNEPDFQDFSNKSVIYKSNLKDLKPELPTVDEEGNYIFTYKKEGRLILDTIRADNPRYIGIDTLYRNLMKR